MRVTVLISLLANLHAARANCSSAIPRFRHVCASREEGDICMLQCNLGRSQLLNATCVNGEWRIQPDECSLADLPCNYQGTTVDLHCDGDGLTAIPNGLRRSTIRIIMKSNTILPQLDVLRTDLAYAQLYAVRLHGYEHIHMETDVFALKQPAELKLDHAYQLPVFSAPDLLVLDIREMANPLNLTQVFEQAPNLDTLRVHQSVIQPGHGFHFPHLRSFSMFGSDCTSDIEVGPLLLEAERVQFSCRDFDSELLPNILPHSGRLQELSVSDAHNNLRWASASALVNVLNATAVTAALEASATGPASILVAIKGLNGVDSIDCQLTAVYRSETRLVCDCVSPGYIQAAFCPQVADFECPGNEAKIAPTAVCNGQSDCDREADEERCQLGVQYVDANTSSLSSRQQRIYKCLTGLGRMFDGQVTLFSARWWCPHLYGILRTWHSIELLGPSYIVRIMHVSASEGTWLHTTDYADNYAHPEISLARIYVNGSLFADAAGVLQNATFNATATSFMALWEADTALPFTTTTRQAPVAAEKISTSNTTLTGFIIGSVLGVVAVLALVWYYRQRRQRSKVQADMDGDWTRMLQEAQLAFIEGHPRLAGQKELNFVDRSQLQVGSVIGTGNFATVHKATWQGNAAVVKTPTCTTVAAEDWFQEALLIHALAAHDAIVAVNGVVLPTPPSTLPSLLMELAPYGELRTVLRQETPPLGPQAQVTIAKQVCQAMCYMSDHGILHRDLAARNVLVFAIAPSQRVKLADFGMSRVLQGSEEYYRARNGDDLPFRWMASEAITHRKWTTAADVWSFGVLLFELATKGSVPYVGQSMQVIVQSLQQGKRLCLPPTTAPVLTKCAQACWQHRATARPTFHQLLDKLKGGTLELITHDLDHGETSL
eukprot:TRINITY_DN12525_c0_g2_i7.p1 TRINITY_DN12525_c0_g2~~TRINITY_DN12525_c0_g2_i7.p1  ORF type:complete len:889 (+),score=133.37 TRINITY_DN12525_c0_g2_i7:1058-3724(+)